MATLIDDIAQAGPITMAYARKKAEAIITGLEKPINDHLLKLMAVAASEETRRHWQGELRDLLDEVLEIRLKPRGGTPPAGFYYRILFDEPFGRVEAENVRARLTRIGRSYSLTSDVAVVDVVDRLRAFHRAFAAVAAAGGRQVDALITDL